MSFDEFWIVVDVAYHLSPFVGRSVAGELVVEVAVPQEGEHAANEAHLQIALLVGIVHVEDVTLVDVLAVDVTQASKLADGITFHLFALRASLLEDANVVLMVS
jgi:hypothetical protein